jgi:predicted DNA-binding protein (MmcQ/YjbR family)
MIPSLGRTPEVSGRRKRLVQLCLSLPEATVEPAGAQHLSFKVKKKIFAYYLCNHHDDGRIALWCKALPGEQARVVSEKPDHYFVPPYVGSKGWVGLRLDKASLSWSAVKDLVFAAYFLTAPNSLRRQIAAAGSARGKATGRGRTSGCS